MSCKFNKKSQKFVNDAESITRDVVSEAQEKLDEFVALLAPAAGEATDRAKDAYEARVIPAVQELRTRVQPLVDNAYGSVETNVKPRIEDAWNKAQSNPRVNDATNRGAAAVAALRGDLELPKAQQIEFAAPKQRHVGRNILIGLGIAGLVAGIAAAIKAVLGQSDDGWTPQQPSRPYQDRSENTWVEDKADDLKADLKADDVDTAAAATAKEAEAIMDDESPATPSEGYGEGSYVGAVPPEGFSIKGNERSMKYHVVDSAGYERTIADVWFNSEEAAEAAGFTRASR